MIVHFLTRLFIVFAKQTSANLPILIPRIYFFHLILIKLWCVMGKSNACDTLCNLWSPQFTPDRSRHSIVY